MRITFQKAGPRLDGKRHWAFRIRLPRYAFLDGRMLTIRLFVWYVLIEWKKGVDEDTVRTVSIKDLAREYNAWRATATWRP